VIDGNKTIAQGDELQKVPEVEFEPHEVYAIDICFSSGEGKVGDTPVGALHVDTASPHAPCRVLTPLMS
jgi:hypothetical protein